MANDLTTVGENTLADYMAETLAVHVALYTAVADAKAGTVTEVAGGSYARVDASALWGAAAAGLKANNAEISFPEATGDWGTVTHFGLHTLAAGGAIEMIAALTASRTISTGVTATFAIGDLELDFTAG